MVSRRTDGALLLRLLQDRLTKLFEACEDLAQRIDSSVLHADERSRQTRQAHFVLKVDDEISIYEHGLEEPTISGAVVRNKWKYLWKHNSLDVVVFLVFLFLFL